MNFSIGMMDVEFAMHFNTKLRRGEGGGYPIQII
jgi:hypothetical protein